MATLTSYPSMIVPNEEAEQSLLGAALIEPAEILPALGRILDERDFLSPPCRVLYQAVRERFIHNQPVDPVLILGDLENAQEWKELITRCVEMVPSIQNWKGYASIVRDTAKRSRAFEKAAELSETLRIGSAAESRELAAKILEELSEQRSDRSYSAKEGFLQFYGSLQQKPDFIPTGLQKLDERSHIQKGKFVVIGARPSAGKTALALQMMLSMSRSHRCVFFSHETANFGLQTRIAAHVGHIPNSRILSREELDYRRISAVYDQLDGYDYHIVEAAGWTVADMAAKAVQLDAEVIFIDYLQLIRAAGHTNRFEKVTDISMELHTLALRQNLAVIALSQLKRPDTARLREPSLEDLRESGQIEQDADIIYLLHAPQGIEAQRGGGPTDRKIILAKNKDGEVGALRLQFYGTTQTFAEV